MELNKKNYELFAAQNYNNPRCVDIDEYHKDLSHLKYLKKHFFTYKKTNVLQERHILNHLIIIHNVFHMSVATQLCFYKVAVEAWPALKTFLLYLNYIRATDYPNVGIDAYVVSKLQKI